MHSATPQAIDAVWRIESAKIVAGVALVRVDELRNDVLDDPVVPTPAG